MWPHIEAAIALLAANADLDDLLPASAAMLNLLHVHDRKEEEAIYAVADRYPTDATQPPLANRFNTRTIPDGWKCRYAIGQS